MAKEKLNFTSDELIEITKYAREAHAYGAKFAHEMLWHFEGKTAIGHCRFCNQKVEVGLDGKDKLTRIGQPKQCNMRGGLYTVPQV